jgi:hypothetical protein
VPCLLSSVCALQLALTAMPDDVYCHIFASADCITRCVDQSAHLCKLRRHFCTYGTPHLYNQYSVSLNFSSSGPVAVKFVYSHTLVTSPALC